MEKSKPIQGGEFIVKDVEPDEIFIPEEFDEEQRMIAQTCQDYLDAEVLPKLDDIDSQKEGLMRSLLDKAGELGLLGLSLPESVGGFEQSFTTSMLANEVMGAGHSYAVAYSCHTGIGSLPILYYGNEEQKQKYLPMLATGEWAGAYCLTEPGAGSDANNGKTKATLSEDGKYYLLNGQKMWITNAGFADVFTVFAKIDNDRVLSAFIVERTFPGITFNPEEKKMGIKGSSTRQIFFNDCKVPVENLLGGRGKGFRIALTILHMGRIKLGSNVLGAAKMAITHSVSYANERKQFGSLISSFGAIKYKLAEQVIKTFTTESAVYRASKNVDETIAWNMVEDAACSKEDSTATAFSQFAVEAAILKVYGSEALDYIVDEAVQIYGGMGFSAEMPVDRSYRDSRINRIFEGTNEINRLLVIDTLMNRGSRHFYDLFEEAQKVWDNLDQYIDAQKRHEDYFVYYRTFIGNLKKLALLLIKAASDKYQRKLLAEQELLNNLSNIIMNIYVGESTLLRVMKLEKIKGKDQVALYKDMLDVYLYEVSLLVRNNGLEAVDVMEAFPEHAKVRKAVKVLSDLDGINTHAIRRRIADKLIEENNYCF